MNTRIEADENRYTKRIDYKTENLIKKIIVSNLKEFLKYQWKKYISNIKMILTNTLLLTLVSISDSILTLPGLEQRITIS